MATMENRFFIGLMKFLLTVREGGGIKRLSFKLRWALLL